MFETLCQFGSRAPGEPNGMDSSKPRSVPTDAREPTEEQRETSHWSIAIRMMDHALKEPTYLKTATLSLQTALAMDGLLDHMH